MSEYYAHSTERADCSDWQLLADHLRGVAERAAAFGDKFGAAKAAALAGWLHDLGKYSEAYQAYIRGSGGSGGSVDHSTAGARHVLELAGTPIDAIIAELVSYAIAGHHAGLPDRSGTSGSLEHRTKSKPLQPLAPAWRHEVTAEAAGLFPAGFRLIQDQPRAAFQMAVLGRMIFSCLVDADRLDTEAHYAAAEGREVDRTWPLLGEHVDRFIAAFDAHMAEKQERLPDDRRRAPLNLLRGDILAQVRGKAGMPKGVFTLEVPTGGGKTLASLAFALQHARRWQMDRIVYAIPFTSIIEQTAAIFREVLGDDSVLEHHASIETGRIHPEEADRRSDQQPEAKLRRAMENWAAPIVVTTNVQLFESLFADRPARCRKLHNLCNAVIILDEAQTIPLHVLRPCVAALDELARNYGCTIVLCTATQPALLAPKFAGGLETVGELAPDPARLHEAFRRVTLRIAGEMMDDALIAELADEDQGLVIVNSRRHARDLYLAGKAAGLAGLIHLTTRQTAADRRRILADIRQRLAAGEPCRVIATSLIEAGVDVSFPRVWRAEAGLDQIIQAAGRCNREWKWPREQSFVIVFRPDKAKPPQEIADFAAAMQRTAADHPDLFSKAAIERYFDEVYWQRGSGLDRIETHEADGRVARAVLGLFQMSAGRTDFAYRTVGEAFRLIKDGMEPVIVAIEDEPKAVLAALRHGMPAAVAARKLQSYVVQVPPRDRRRLVENGHATFVEGFDDQFVVLRTESFYSRAEGLVWEQADELGTENFMV